jgi:hypothetical protein
VDISMYSKYFDIDEYTNFKDNPYKVKYDYRQVSMEIN